MAVPTNLIGKRIGKGGRIELVQLLNTGSYGAVYRGLVHRPGIRLPKACAVKVQRNTADKRERLRHARELQLHARVRDGDGIVPLYETFVEGAYIFIIMKFCADGDLWSSINEGRLLGRDALIKDIFTQILDATQYCHSKSVYHRDIKPENILLCNGGHKALLGDFGLATDEPISTELRVGSAWYMSPECWGGLSVEPYSTATNDIWSLGVLLINLACGEHAPWKCAHQSDPFFRDFIKQPNLLRLFVPVSPQVHDILARIFVSKTIRISIKDLRAAVSDVQHFTVPPWRRIEYYNYQRAVWKATVGPSPSRPLSIKVVPPSERPFANDHNQATLVYPAVRGPVHTPPLVLIPARSPAPAPAPALDHDTTVVAIPPRVLPSPGLLSARVRSRSLPPLPGSSSSGSSADSDGPITPDMPPTDPKIAVPEMDALSPPQAPPHPKGARIVLSYMRPPPQKPQRTRHLSSVSWSGLLDVIQEMI